jgi:hypothetical protein
VHEVEQKGAARVEFAMQGMMLYESRRSNDNVVSEGLARTIYTVYTRYCWLGNHQTYGYIRFVHMVLANPKYKVLEQQQRQDV